MREILFRGKRQVNGQWVEGWYEPPVTGRNPDGSEVSFSECITFIRDEDGFLDDANIIHDTVGQYTGLTDKNGKKIFEGDIVTISSVCTNMTGVVEYHDCGFEVREDDTYECLWYEPDELEVIGNIHDNPELLEVSDNG